MQVGGGKVQSNGWDEDAYKGIQKPSRQEVFIEYFVSSWADCELCISLHSGFQSLSSIRWGLEASWGIKLLEIPKRFWYY